MIPQGILAILRKLKAHGQQAYLVGGCVRDILLCRSIHDWDITTSATPEKVMELFSHTIPTGLKHGTVTVVEDNAIAEVTTFRCDGAYSDCRHPKQVIFVKSLEEDLSRRDFTVNAMAMDESGMLFDYFGGREDLEAKVIRCVGDAQTRFGEDALRMLRAFRFCAQLSFSVHPSVLEAVAECAVLVKQVSVERLREELEKILLSPNPDILHELVQYRLLEHLSLHAVSDKLSLATLPCEPMVRWSGCFYLYSALCADILRLDKHTQHTAAQAAKDAQTPFSRLQCKRVIARCGYEVAYCYAALCGKIEVYEEILHCRECVCLSQLAVKGNDLPYQGKQVGQVLERMLQYVLEHPEKNERAFLLYQDWKV